MKITLLEGLHLTASNRSHIAHAIENDWPIAVSARITYRFLEHDKDAKTATICFSKKETDGCGRSFVRKSTVKISYAS